MHLVSVLLLFIGLSFSAAAEVLAPETIAIPSGKAIIGSDRVEREAGYRLDEMAYGHSVTRKQRWYESERDRQEVSTGAYQIMRHLVTNRDYLAFVKDTGHPMPDVSEVIWQGYGLIHPFERTRRHAWTKGRPPDGRELHPVVLVNHSDARAFAAWLSRKTGQIWRLPTETEWERAARGDDGRRFPWGDEFDASLLNSHDAGSFDTVPVGQYPNGASPLGLMDAAGQVFEWTAAPKGRGRYFVKGGSWDDSGCGVCRPAARHSRPADLKHILIGFRLVREMQ